MTYKDWRDDSDINRTYRYSRKFAILPKRCNSGELVWLRFYYSKYQYAGHAHQSIDTLHKDFIENITESEYIVRKLAENL